MPVHPGLAPIDPEDVPDVDEENNQRPNLPQTGNVASSLTLKSGIVSLLAAFKFKKKKD